MTVSSTARLGWGGTLLGLLSICLLTASAVGYRYGWWPAPRAVSVAEAGVWVALAGALVSLAGLVPWLRRGRGGLVFAVIGFLISAPVIGLGVAWEVATRTTPPINDISTDTADPPMFWDTPMPADYPPANAEAQRQAYPEVTPLDLPVPADEAFERAHELVKARGWDILAADENERRIEAVATSRLYGFKDEVAVRVTETEAGSVIDMRSRSRIGQIDRGANARRIGAFLSDLKDAIRK